MRAIFIFFFLLFLTLSCQNESKQSGQNVVSVEKETVPVEELREIFYHMYLPDEMSRLFERSGANYDSDLVNSPDNFSRYNDENRISVAVGIYGVDLGYSRIYDQNVTSASFLSTIRLLTEKLGIPPNSFEDIYNRIELNISNQDSVARITTDLYKRTDIFLKENNKESLAALIVYGGWIEALYIASKILEKNPGNMEIMDRIAEQKYSLNSLISLLNNYQDNLFVSENLLLAKKLKRLFDKFEIYYMEDSFSLDTITKKISSGSYRSGLTPELVQEITRLVSDIRTLLIL